MNKIKKLKNLAFLSFLLLVMGISSVAIRKAQIFKNRAETNIWEITVDGNSPKNLFKFWQNFAQGGEEREKMIEPVMSEVSELNPSYIRIDHVFDFYNWEELDQRIEEILAAGATPFLCLSYLPPSLSKDGSVTSAPKSFLEWQNLVKTTIERYSGKEGKNISGIYYEVWNEPDLFGQMSPQQYFLLYQHAVLGAQEAKNPSVFKIGGPATIGINKSWMDNFLQLVNANNVRLDFVSWHSYGKNPNRIGFESQTLDSLPNFAPFLGKTEKIVSEWGSDSEISPIHDTYFDAAHTIATVSQSIGKVDKMLAFEIKDGPDPQGKQFWGRWGLLTHQKTGTVKKPRYHAFAFLNHLQKYFLSSSVNNFSNLYPIVSTDGMGNYSLIVAFYPFEGKENSANFSIKITNFPAGEFEETILFLSSQKALPYSTTTFSSSKNFWEKNFNLDPFSTIFINLKRISAATAKTSNQPVNQNGKAALITSNSSPLIYPTIPSFFENQTSGEISFSFSPFWQGTDPEEYYFFEAKNSPQKRIYALKRKNEGFGSRLDFVFESGEFKKNVSLDISHWKTGNWYKVSFRWDNPTMELVLKEGENEIKETMGVIDQVAIGKFLYIGADSESKLLINGMVDDLIVKFNNQLIINENFD